MFRISWKFIWQIQAQGSQTRRANRDQQSCNRLASFTQIRETRFD